MALETIVKSKIKFSKCDEISVLFIFEFEFNYKSRKMVYKKKVLQFVDSYLFKNKCFSIYKYDTSYQNNW